MERRLTTGTLLNNGMVLIAGGININGTLDSAELYNPANKTFTFTGNLNGLRCYHTATLLNSGMVLIEGGEQPSGSTFVPLASAELYNPANGTFTVTGNLNAARVGPTATPLNNGTVLVTGGVEFSGETDVPQSSAEVYDPVAATFATTGSLNSARATQSATLLTNGTVLVTGGFDASGSLASAEFYEPGTLTPAGLTAITVSAAPPTTPATPTISPGTTSGLLLQELLPAATNSSTRLRGVLRIPGRRRSATTQRIRAQPWPWDHLRWWRPSL